MDNWQQTVASEFANSPTIMQMLASLNEYLDPSADIDAFFDDLWNIETAQGYGLDVWGRIVGVNRVLTVSAAPYFGFTGPSGASGKPWNQAVFYNGQAVTSNVALTDDAYRTLILAKASANVCRATIPAINQLLINLFGPNGALPIAGNSYCTDGGGMTMTYTFPSGLTPLQHSIIYQSNVLPTPCGVLASVVT